MERQKLWIRWRRISRLREASGWEVGGGRGSAERRRMEGGGGGAVPSPVAVVSLETWRLESRGFLESRRVRGVASLCRSPRLGWAALRAES
jgi:hypothetical protein